MTSTTSVVADSAAISALEQTFAAQKAAFLAAPYPTAGERRAQLTALSTMVLQNRDLIREAMSADFTVHPGLFTDLVEVLGVAGRAAYAAEQLDAWMAPEPRPADPAIYGTATVEVRRQPKGVVGNIVPWNFPFDIALGSLADLLAAGNRVIIKPSELAPACAELLSDMISSTFPPDHVAVVTGGLELAKTFSTLAWDHLLYTGNPAVARQVARAAAENLVPLTLELGGKNPVVIHSDSVDKATVGHILATKLVKNGQMCISADYCLVPRDQVDSFVALAQEHFREQFADFSTGADATGIITEHHLDRLTGLLEQARDRGARVVDLEPDAEADRTTRQMPLSLVIDPADDLDLMREEIFGPILPIKPYDTLEEAIGIVNAADRPLGLYVFAADERVAATVLAATTSGSAAVNVCAAQGAVPSLGFGGSGTSGYGRHHGVDGFREFSNPRGVVVRGTGDLMDAFFPPYGALAQAVVDEALPGKTN